MRKKDVKVKLEEVDLKERDSSLGSNFVLLILKLRSEDVYSCSEIYSGCR